MSLNKQQTEEALWNAKREEERAWLFCAPLPLGTSPKLLHSGPSWSAHGRAFPFPGDELTVAFTVPATSTPGRSFRCCDRPT